MRGYALLLEATLSLLLAATLLLALPLQQHATHKELQLYQLLEDAMIVGAKKYPKETSSFSQGSASAKKELEKRYSEMLGGVGGYCLTIKARENYLEANCEKKQCQYEISETIGMFDGKAFYEARFTLKA